MTMDGQATSTVDQASDDEPILCPACGYDLRGTEGERCSECGGVVDRAALKISGFPWARRGEIGRVRAYIKTVWLVSIGSRSLRNEASKPQDLRGARVFRWITAGIMGVTLVGVFLAIVEAEKGLAFLAVQPRGVKLTGTDPQWQLDLLVPWSAGATIPGFIPVALVMLAVYLTGVQRRLFRLRDMTATRQERLEAIGCYAVAPLVWLMPAALCSGVAIGLLPLEDASSLAPYALLAALWFALVAAGIAGPFVRVVQWVVRTRHGGVEQGLLALVRLSGLWLLGIILWIGLVPWAIGFLWIVIDSFR